MLSGVHFSDRVPVSGGDGVPNQPGRWSGGHPSVTPDPRPSATVHPVPPLTQGMHVPKIYRHRFSHSTCHGRMYCIELLVF